jgi:transcriptional regulator with XRE-family HTH domain
MTLSLITPAIVNNYLNTTGLSMRKFAFELGVSHAAVSNWASGKSEPDIYFLLDLLKKFCDWRREFAIDLMGIMAPDVASAMSGNGHKSASPCEEEGGKQ